MVAFNTSLLHYRRYFIQILVDVGTVNAEACSAVGHPCYEQIGKFYVPSHGTTFERSFLDTRPHCHAVGFKLKTLPPKRPLPYQGRRKHFQIEGAPKV